MRKANLIRELEKSINEKFPDNIGDILIEAGFTTKTSLSKLDFNSLRSIEKYVQDNPEKFGIILKDTRYEQSVKFKFLPGHEALLLSLPEEILRIKDQKEQKKTRKRRHSETDKVSSESKSDTNENTDSAISEKKKRNSSQK